MLNKIQTYLLITVFTLVSSANAEVKVKSPYTSINFSLSITKSVSTYFLSSAIPSSAYFLLNPPSVAKSPPP